MNRSLIVPGVPIAQGSKKIVGPHRMVESSKRLKPWRAKIVAAILEAGWQNDPILTGPVAVSLAFIVPRPAYHYGTGRNAGVLKANAPTWCDKAVGDIDKLTRAVLDAITTSGAWRDDAQVAQLSAYRLYGVPGVTIDVGRLEP